MPTGVFPPESPIGRTNVCSRFEYRQKTGLPLSASTDRIGKADKGSCLSFRFFDLGGPVAAGATTSIPSVTARLVVLGVVGSFVYFL